MTISRRDFVRRFASCAGCYVATASLSVLPTRLNAQSRASVTPGESPRFWFPQGIASADPHPDAVVLWTRVQDAQSNDAAELVAQVARDPAFSDIVLESAVSSAPQLDQTLRVFVQGLDPSNWYWYRFVTSDGYASPVGRTCTAPHPEAEEPLRLAMFSCQSFETGYYNAYRRLVVDDSERPLDEQTRLCVHVGDWYYETVGGSMTSMNDIEPETHWPDGTPHNNAAIPSGGPGGGRPYAYRLDDFRYLHQQNLSDAALREARALYPFVYIWDDHEVRNDYWQSYANAGPLQRNKVDSNQAWFEYCPAALSRAAAGPAGFNPARDFASTEVENTELTELDENYLSLEENNLKAINSLTIYRSLAWGKTADLILVDGRSYRGQRGVDDGILGSNAITYPYQPIDPALVDILAAGRNANGGNPPATVSHEGQEIPNPRREAPETSMLGETQKDWLKQTLANSTAQWKVLCNNVPMMGFGFDSLFVEHGVIDGIYFSDSWDGYPNERNEIMQFIRETEIPNVISLTGDRHAHYAGLVYDDYRSAEPFPVIAELVGASISAGCRQLLGQRLAAGNPFFEQVAAIDAGDYDYIYQPLPALNAWMLFGSQAAMRFKATRDASETIASADSRVNPHLRYADNDAYGFFRVVIDQEKCAAEFVTVPQPIRNFTTADDPPIRRRVRVDVPATEPGEAARLENIRFEGERPLLGLKS